MGVSKVNYAGKTLVDLTNDTVVPSALFSGYTAHNKSGERISGTAVPILQWKNTANGSYKFVQSGDRWIANNRGINSSTAISTWKVTVPYATTAYIGWRTSTESLDKLSITLNGTSVLSATGGLKSSETVLTLSLVAGENTLVATYTKDGSTHSYGDMAYIVMPPIGEPPGQYKYQSKSVTPSTSLQTIYPDAGYDGLYSVSVNASSASLKCGSFITGSGGTIHDLNIGFTPSYVVLFYDENSYTLIYNSLYSTTKSKWAAGSVSIVNISTSSTHGFTQIGSVTKYKVPGSGYSNKGVHWIAWS